MSTAHTPGPWITNGYRYIYGPDYYILCDVGPIDIVSSANARLIAAAPELLAALKALLQLDESDERIRGESMRRKPAQDTARAAIAKAEGAQETAPAKPAALSRTDNTPGDDAIVS